MNLLRKGHTNTNATSFGVMDNLTYVYDEGNKLSKVADSANKTIGFKDGSQTGADYSYDVNGNMLTEANKGIVSIQYNYLNLPTKVNFGSGKTITGTIDYTYDASGVKQSKTVTGSLSSPETTEYVGNYVYNKVSGRTTTVTLEFFNHAEGYVKNKNGIFSYVYQYKDHFEGGALIKGKVYLFSERASWRVGKDYPILMQTRME